MRNESETDSRKHTHTEGEKGVCGRGSGSEREGDWHPKTVKQKAEMAWLLQEIETAGHLTNENKRINFSVMEMKGMRAPASEKQVCSGQFLFISFLFLARKVCPENRAEQKTCRKRENKTETNAKWRD